jgi:hypothetical protein
MISGIPGTAGRNIQNQIFYPSSVATSVGWQTYSVPKSVTMLYIFLLAGGGGGGAGFAGGVSGGGGGGGSSGQTSVLIPAAMLPSTLYLSIGHGGSATTAGIASRISVVPNATANHTLALANPGGGGSNSTSGTGGGAGAAGTVATIATMPLAALGQYQLLAGQIGQIGGASGANGLPITLPVTGLVVTGGASGAGIPAAGANPGFTGGSFTVPAGNYVFPPHTGGAGGLATPTPPQQGSNGINFVNGLNYFYGGAGGGSTAGNATGNTPPGSNVRGAGGNGGFGCGGGGGGAGLTGAGAGAGGRGGDGLAIIYAW